jgi:hypothetical protein
VKWVRFKCWSVKRSSFIFLLWCKMAMKRRWRHSTGTDFRLTLMPTYLKMALHLKVTVTRTTGKRQAADSGPSLHNLDFLHLWYYTCKMYLFLSIIVQVCHDQRDRLKDYWSTLEQLFMAFTEIQWNETDSFMYWDVCILVTTEMNLIRQAKIMTSFQTVYTKETQMVWDKNLQAMWF